MLINSSNYSIGELVDMLDRRDLLVNNSYQRAAGLWPEGPSSYFIDTILEGFPFPKIYMYEYINRSDRRTKKEIVDGQQRITTIRRYLNNEFRVRGDSPHAGKLFRELDDETQDKFMSYTVSTDVIRNASRAEILQMFRRMNAYTLPLNNAEKRHSSFSGEFKWFINEMSDSLNEFFTEFGVFTDRQIVRMGDAEFISDCVISIEKGIVSASPTDLNRLYENNEASFAGKEDFYNKLHSAFVYISSELEPLRKGFMMKPYALHSLITALVHVKFGIPEIIARYNIQPLGDFPQFNPTQRLLSLAQAHETKDANGPYHRYVWGTESSTNKLLRREARVMSILAAFGCDMQGTEYDNLF